MHLSISEASIYLGDIVPLPHMQPKDIDISRIELARKLIDISL